MFLVRASRHEQNLPGLFGNQTTPCKFHCLFICHRGGILCVPLALSVWDGECPAWMQKDPLLAHRGVEDLKIAQLAVYQMSFPVLSV